MKLTNLKWLCAGRWIRVLLLVVLMGWGTMAHGTVSMTTIQGTVYLANGNPASGTLVISWPSFTTADGQLIVADSLTVTIGSAGYVSVNLAPNAGATPAGQFYTATYDLSDGTTSTEYWVVPAATQTTLGAIQAEVMPTTEAVQAVDKAYVDDAIAALAGSVLPLTGGTLSGALYLNADPTQSLQAADKHYVDDEFALAVPLTGGTLSGALTATKLGALYQVDQFTGSDFGAKLSACLSGLDSTYGGTCDARNFTGTLSMGSGLTISTGNATILLPCATITTAQQVIVAAGVRNVTIHGCAYQGGSTANGIAGGTVWVYTGSGAAFAIGDSTYAADTKGFSFDNANLNTASASAAASIFAFYRTQEIRLDNLYLNGNQLTGQTAVTLDGTGDYAGGLFENDTINGFGTGFLLTGHLSGSVADDYANASAFNRVRIICPTSSGSPIAGTYGFNVAGGDGNTWSGGDVEGCSTALHLGANATSNTINGLRNENSTNQVVADLGSSYNSWITGGTMFTGDLTDNGTRNSFLDTFHRSFNGLNGDWYQSQKDATVTNHYRIGTGTGNERGLLNRYQTDYGYRWTTGLSDATAGEQFYEIQDELNNVYRLSIGQYNNGQSSTNNQTVINAAGTGAIVLNGSNNAGTGGVVFGSGGTSESTVATINNAGNAWFNGTLQVGGTPTFASSLMVKNQADAEVDATLWAGLTTAQKESFIYKDWNGASQWYMVKDKSNNWALNSAIGGLNSFKAYQSTNGGDTYVNAAISSGTVRVNYEPGSGTGFAVYGGNNSSLYASFTGTTAIRFPGLEASSGHNCLQIDNSGYITNTGAACGSGSGTSGTINSGTTGQIAYYTASGTTIGGENTVPITAGGTGAATAAAAFSNLLPGASYSGSGSSQVVSLPGNLSAQAVALGSDPTVETNAATKNYSDIHGGGVVNLTQEYGCTPLTAAQYATQSAAGVWTDVNGNTACINNAIAAVCAKSAGIYYSSRPRIILEPGTYVIGNSATEGLVENNCQLDLEGNGWKSTILQHATGALVEDASGNAYTVTTDGAWNPSTTYSVNQVVSRMSNAYVAIAANTDADPWADTTGTNWVQVYSRLLSIKPTGGWLETGSIQHLNLATGPTTTDLFFTDGILDSPFLINEVQFIGAEKNIVNGINVPTWLNGHITNSRFDGLGGYAAAFPGLATATNRQYSMGALDFIDCTYDNGGNESASGGNGVFFSNFTAGTSGTINLSSLPYALTSGTVNWIDGRIELNQLLNTYSTASDGLQRSLFRVIQNGLNSSNQTFPLITIGIHGSSLLGYELSYNPETLNAKIVSSDTGEVGLDAEASNVYDFTEIKNNDSGTSLEAVTTNFGLHTYLNHLSPYASNYPAGRANSADQIQGINIVASNNLSNVQGLTTGTLVLNKSSIAGTNNSAIYQASCSGNGAGATTPATLPLTGTMAAGSTTLTLSAAHPGAWIMPQNGIVVAGAGPSGANLTANILHIVDDTVLLNTASRTLILDTAASTAVSGATLTQTQCTLNPVVQSASQVNGAALSASATVVGTNASGQIVSQTGTISNNTSGSATSLSAASALPNGTTATTQATTDNSTKVATTAYTQAAIAAKSQTPAWLEYLGTGADGAYKATAASCTASAPCALYGDNHYTTFSIDSGAYVYTTIEGRGGLVVHATGACKMYGTLLVNGAKNSNPATSFRGVAGGASGGSGGGTSAGTTGTSTVMYYGGTGTTADSAGAAGVASGGNGGNAGNWSWGVTTNIQRMMLSSAGVTDGMGLAGASGQTGANSGGAFGEEGQGFVAICASIDGTGGVIDASGGYGGPAVANSTGAGSGGGGGVVLLSSQATATAWPSIYVAGGPGGLATVPEAVATGGTCTTQPKATLGVTSGALNGTCTVVQAGAGCGTGAGITWNILGGGGTAGTVTPTWSGGALASCTASGGSGYTAATYTTAGKGGDGAPGWYQEFQNW
jgi:hypothetical protein